MSRTGMVTVYTNSQQRPKSTSSISSLTGELSICFGKWLVNALGIQNHFRFLPIMNPIVPDCKYCVCVSYRSICSSWHFVLLMIIGSHCDL